jgi:7-cyano-7-deazaguanine reductase
MLIETFENPAQQRDYEITHINAEFTSVCPKTGLPDFGSVKIRYIPDKLCLELKALKYYFMEFRNKGIFYEAVTNVILDDLINACDPKSMEIITEWKIRGGMTSIIKAEYKKV